MKKIILLATVAALASATGANAATLIKASVTGPTGTVWTTAPTNGYYTLFLQNPALGDFLNPNNEAINFNVPNSGSTRVLLAGEGFLPNTTSDSDSIYNLTLTFDGGQTLTGSYSPLTNSFLSGSSFTSGNVAYSLSEFSFRRFLGDAVQANVATPGGDGNDYVGNFRIATLAGAVPEPASWAMMIGGFGLMGGAIRRRARPSTKFA